MIEKSMKKNRDEEIVYSINVNDLQEVSGEVLERRLTKREIALVGNSVGNYLDWSRAIEHAIRDFGERARKGALQMEELTGGTFTITNGGIFGSMMSTPILNPPQSGILGMHKIQSRPMVVGGVVDGKIEARPMMYLALTYDHRLVDGREAVQFLVHVKDVIEDPARLLLEI